MNQNNLSPLLQLFFRKSGRINRRTYWLASLFIWTSFYVIFNLVEHLVSYNATLIIYPLLYWTLGCTAIKRLHDTGLSGWWLLLIIIPVFGPLLLVITLGFRKGKKEKNKYGKNPNLAEGYFENPSALTIKHLKSGERIVNDVSQLNPVLVANVVVPKTIDDIINTLKTTDGDISVGGGRFSMGGQTASPYSTHLDMRRLNRVIAFEPELKIIKVEAGIRWCDIQQFIDPYDLSIKVMQSYANFTVGGSVSVNCHGRYVGYGSVVTTVKSMDVILADGDLLTVSRLVHRDIFEAIVGCYGAVAIIVAVELDLSDNIAIERKWKLMNGEDYPHYFNEKIKSDKGVILHNADLYPPLFTKTRAVSWVETSKKPSKKSRLMNLAAHYPLEQFFIQSFSRNNFAKWRRQHLIEPVLYSRRKIHLRNYEAGYDVAELEPASKEYSSYILQEYFIPVEQFNYFVPLMSEVFIKYRVNVINVSVRHAFPNSESLLSWCDKEVFAFVIWYKQSSNEKGKNKVGVWTRELTEIALSFNGSYYLPYQPHATIEQFNRAFPRAEQLFYLKQQLDPKYRFKNALWEKYYQATKNYTND